MIYQITNKNENDYSDGFSPDYKVREVNYLVRHNGLPSLRKNSAKDPLVSKAISVIIGGASMQALRQTNLAYYQFQGKLIGGSSYIQSHGNLMIASPEILKEE